MYNPSSAWKKTLKKGSISSVSFLELLAEPDRIQYFTLYDKLHMMISRTSLNEHFGSPS